MNKLFKPENRDELILNGMKKIDELQLKTIEEAYKIIVDKQEFEKSIHLKFQNYLQNNR